MEQNNEIIYKNRMLILFNIVLMTFMATLDSSIVNVALPTMAEKLSVSTQAISWVVSSYLIAIVGTILVFGNLGDIVGKTKIFQYGVFIFTLGSLLCGVANSFSFLMVARVIQAIGASATFANNQGIITQVFPSKERGKALGISATFVALGSMAGPPIGGLLVSVLSWKYIFLINVPIGIFVYLLCQKILPRSEKVQNVKLDLKGAALFAISITTLFCTLSVGEAYGYHPIFIGIGFAVCIISFVIFLRVEKRTKVPLLHLGLFKNKIFSLSLFCAFTSYVGINSVTIIQPFYLQNTLNYTSTFCGVIMIVSPLVVSVVAPVSGFFSDKIGSELLTFIGLVFTSSGLFFMSTLQEHSSLSVILLSIVIMAIGNGLFQSPNNSLVMSSSPSNMLGISGSVNALIRNLGMITGTSLAVFLLYNRMSSKIGYRVSTYIEGRDDVFVYGMQVAYIVAGMICALGAILTAIRLYVRRHKT